MQLEDIQKLAKLARIDMGEEEMKGIVDDFDSILAYVDQVQEAVKFADNSKNKLALHSTLENITREDIATENPNQYASRIIEEMPDKEGRYLKVRQIL